jgi:predicted lipoprotein with Yx(FWY)xxD motif
MHETINKLEGRHRRHRAHRAARVATALVGSGVAISSFGIAAAGASSTASVVIATVKNKTLGTILVSKDRTLYILKGNMSCTGSCLKFWPPVLLPKGIKSATAGMGVSASKLGVVTRSGGSRQVTYLGKELYWFVGDTAAGQVKGNGVKDSGGIWSVVVVSKAGSSGSGTGAGGYGY